MSTIFMCRWAECRLEFEEEDRYKEHVNSHVESLQPMLVSNIPDYRRAAGFGPASSAPQPQFDYLNTQDSNPNPFLKGASPSEVFKSKKLTRKRFSALGLGGQATPPLSPLIPSPSMSAKIRGIASPLRGQTRPQWGPPSPIHGLASSVANDGSFATPSDPAFSPAARQGPSEHARLDDDGTRTPVTARSRTPDDDTSTENPRKRKQSVMFNQPVTPANKKKKKNPKTPFPDPDLDSSDEDSDHQGQRLTQDEIEALANPAIDGDPYLLFTQAPGSSWDELETPEEDMAASFFLKDPNRSDDTFIEEVEEENAVATQLGGDDSHVEEVTSPSVTSP